MSQSLSLSITSQIFVTPNHVSDHSFSHSCLGSLSRALISQEIMSQTMMLRASVSLSIMSQSLSLSIMFRVSLSPNQASDLSLSNVSCSHISDTHTLMSLRCETCLRDRGRHSYTHVSEIDMIYIYLRHSYTHVSTPSISHACLTPPQALPHSRTCALSLCSLKRDLTHWSGAGYSRYVTWLIRLDVWHGSFLRDMTHLYPCMTWLIPTRYDSLLSICGMTYSYVTWLVRVDCGMTHSSVAWLIHIDVWHDPFLRDMTHSYRTVTWPIPTWHDSLTNTGSGAALPRMTKRIHTWHDLFT